MRILRDGTAVVVRPLEPDDRPGLAAGFRALSTRSRYHRFFVGLPALDTAMLDRLVDGVDGHLHVAVVLVTPAADGPGTPIAVGRLIRTSESADRAEIAVTVADEWQRRGAGGVLAEIARGQRVRYVTAMAHVDNAAVWRLLAHVGPLVSRTAVGPGVDEAVLALGG